MNLCSRITSEFLSLATAEAYMIALCLLAIPLPWGTTILGYSIPVTHPYIFLTLLPEDVINQVSFLLKLE